MALVDSRLGPGTLTFGAADRSFQAANVRLTPSVDETDGTPTLAEPEPAPLAKVSWALEGTIIQDFTAGATSFVNWLADHALEEVEFEFVPLTAAAGLSYAGTVQVRPVPIGGDAATQLTSDFSLPLIGALERTDPVGGG